MSIDASEMGRDLGRAPSYENHGSVRFDAEDIERSIPELFERRVRADPRRTALGCEEQSLSYDDLNRVSNRIARAILRRRRDKEEPTALLFHQGPTAVTAIIGALKSGKIYVPLEPNQPMPELQQIIAQCQPSLILCERETEALAGSLMDNADRSLNVETMTADEPEIDPGRQLAPDRACYIFYTSGTTGPPKGVFDHHRNVLHNIMRYTNSLGIGPKDRLSLIQSCSFSGTVSSLFSALLNGAAICPFDLQRQGIARLASWVEREEITVFHSTPAIFEQMVKTGRDFDSLRMIRLEGDLAEPRQISLFQSRLGADCVLVNGLGLTEAGIVRQYFVTSKTRLDGDVRPVGYATEDMEIKVVDRENCQVEQGSVGEIVIRSEYLACGYWQRPDLTSASFVPDPIDGNLRTYRTGDLGRMRADGLLEYVGRKDSQVKLRGQWVDLAKIEGALCAMDSIRQALVVVGDDGSGGQQLVAYVVPAGAQPRIDKIRRSLGDTLPAVMIPSRYVFSASIPLDRNGKVDRRRLPPLETQHRILEQTFVGPRFHEERIIADCFKTVLKMDQVGVDDDFLDLGGDSLLATELLRVIEKRLGVKCPAALISRTFNVASITSRLCQRSPESAIVPIQIGDRRSPLFCIHHYSGTVLDYYRLAASLDPDQTVYGIQSRAFTRAGQQDARIEDMAAAYVEEIISVQPDGPYQLCGDCLGGTIAFEIAQQLRRQGREVALVALINTLFPGNFLYYVLTHIQSPYALRRLTKLPVKSWPRYLADRFQNLVRWGARRIIPEAKRVRDDGRRSDSPGFSVIKRNLLAEARYKPGQYDGEIVLICAGPPYNQRGWIGVATGGCRVIEIPLKGDPLNLPQLTLDPYVGTLAAQLSELMES